MGEIRECYNTGMIESTGNNTNGDCELGGIAGATVANTIITTCYNRGEIKGSHKLIGGIVGNLNIGATVEYCYNTFTIQESQEQKAGPIIGDSSRLSAVQNCYYLGNETNGMSRTEADMKTQDFINLIGGNTYWKLDTQNKNNGFIILSWQ